MVLKIYLLIINSVAFILFGVDKWKAIQGKWRIRERTLLGISAFGGALGGLAAMYLFRHKTKHLRFALGLPCMLLVHIALFYWIS